jgi:hypothetical protein
MSSLSIKIVERNDSYVVVATAKGALGEASFGFELEEGSRTAQVIDRISTGDCTLDDLRDVGSQLFTGVFSGDVATIFDACRSGATPESPLIIRLSLPVELQQLPWESLYDEKKDTFLVSRPKFCVVREPPEALPPSRAPTDPLRRLKVLVVIPSGSGLQVDHEWQNLQSAVEQCGDAIQLTKIDGRVTPERLQRELKAGNYDVLHYIGHGELARDRSFKIRLNGDDTYDGEYWMDAEVFADLFESTPRLVVLNCCLGAAASPTRTLSGLGPALLRAGIPAVVAMRYEIPDNDALRFADTFYRELLTGSQPGRVDLALNQARRALYVNQREGATRGFVTPVLYLAQDHESLFQLNLGTPETSREARPRKTDVRGPALPPDLVSALRNRKCVIVAGPGILRAGASRSIAMPLGPRELAERLGAESSYRRADDFAHGDANDGWMETICLPAVCQHYQDRLERFRLIESIRSAYQGVEPPPAFLTLAGLNPPAIVYTHFDGLLEEAHRRKGKQGVQVISRLDQRREVSSPDGLLVFIRGKVREEASLVLTEDDNELLLERMAKMPRQIQELMRGQLGRSALFVGVSPRDRLIRTLSRQFLEEKGNRIQGPSFIVSAEPDSAYWRKYGIEWIQSPLDDFFTELQQATL